MKKVESLHAGNRMQQVNDAIVQLETLVGELRTGCLGNPSRDERVCVCPISVRRLALWLGKLEEAVATLRLVKTRPKETR